MRLLTPTPALTILALLLAAAPALRAQEDEGRLFLQLDEALPRKATVRGPRVSQQARADWDAALDAIGAVLAKSAGTRVEPFARFYMGNALFNTNQLDEADAVFSELARQFPDHPLVTVGLGEEGKSLVRQALDDCAAELAFRQKHTVEQLPKPVVDESLLVTLHTTAGDVKLRFFENAAPEHRENFLKLARSGFYDGTAVHRIDPDAVVYMGCPNTKDAELQQWGRGGPGYTLDHEFSRVSHEEGIVTASQAPRARKSHGSQFQILLKDRVNLDFLQTPFAVVVEGLDHVRRVSTQTRNQFSQPAQRCYINGITIEKTPPK